MTIYNFYSTAGGQGCTVAAAVFAATNDRKTLLYDRAGDSRAALGLSASIEITDVNELFDVYDGNIQPEFGLYEDVVIDWGKQKEPNFSEGVNVLVVKPCYLALRRSVATSTVCKPDTILLYQDHDSRAIRPVDVEAAVGCKIGYIMRHDEAIARTVDAGLLSARTPRQLSELNSSIKEAINASTQPSRR
jgi:hypothetical protein